MRLTRAGFPRVVVLAVWSLSLGGCLRVVSPADPSASCVVDADCNSAALEVCQDGRCVVDARTVDNDQDGYAETRGDCDDTNAAIHPTATEVCGDGIDQDCLNGDVACQDFDGDGDGFSPAQGDCDDAQPAAAPGRVEVCGNTVDEDCSGAPAACGTFDGDRDGFTPDSGDCDDTNALVSPAAFEVCGNTADEDCDGQALTCAQTDGDLDGFSPEQGDCDDTNRQVSPRARELCGNGLDEDCAGGDLACANADQDGDTFTPALGDCDDADPRVHPAAREVCGNAGDEDCDGASPACSAFDADGDGYSPADGDCDDADRRTNPAALEVCGNSVDEDCDLVAPTCMEFDRDGDGFAPMDNDCDDNNPRIHPLAREVCDNTVDENCDGTTPACVDFDRDGDGYTPNGADLTAGTADDDCNDNRSDIHPDAPDICEDGINQNCALEPAGLAAMAAGDALCPVHMDRDGDGYSSQPYGGRPGGDCDDTNFLRRPGSLEACNLLDDDCDGVVDEGAVACTTYDHQGAAWTVANDDPYDLQVGAGIVLGGFHLNVGAFVLPAGVTAAVAPLGGIHTGRLRVEAQSITVAGTLDASGAGFGGGGGGGGGRFCITSGGSNTALAGAAGRGRGGAENGAAGTGYDPGRGGAGAGPLGGAGGQPTLQGDCVGMACGVRGGAGPGTAAGYQAAGANGDVTVLEEVFLGSGGGGGSGSAADWYQPNVCPAFAGSGGGAGGTGGGALELVSQGPLQVNGGTIRANGAPGGNGTQTAQKFSGFEPYPNAGEGGHADVTGQSASAGDGGAGGTGAGGGILLKSVTGAVVFSANPTVSALGSGAACTPGTINGAGPHGSVKIISGDPAFDPAPLKGRLCAGRYCSGSPGGNCTNVP